MTGEIKKPLINFLEFFMHLHKLNTVIINSLDNYEKMLDAADNVTRVLKKFKPEENYEESENALLQRRGVLETVKKEINENYYTIKSTEVILLYARFECAIAELIQEVFLRTDISQLREVEAIKINAVPFLKLSKKERNILLSNQYITQTTQSTKYGFARFEAQLKPICGISSLQKKDQDCIFRFAQVRNLLIHKNGIIDKQFKELFKEKKYKLNSMLEIDSKLLGEFYDAIILYSSDILERIDVKFAEV